MDHSLDVNYEMVSKLEQAVTNFTRALSHPNSSTVLADIQHQLNPLLYDIIKYSQDMISELS